MSLFNNLFGFSPEAELLLNIIGLEPENIPRFRDCFYHTELHLIVVHTRTGGGNREEYQIENNLMAANPFYVNDEDDSFDSTYANFYFHVPEKYKEKLIETFKDRPTITPNMKWDSLFKAMGDAS